MAEYDPFEQLKALFRIVTPVDLASNFKVENFSNVHPEPTIIGNVLKNFVDTVDASGSGLLTYQELLDRTRELSLSKEEEKYVRFYDELDVDSVLGVPRSENDVARLRVMSLNAPGLGISLRDVNRVGIFMNSVPTYELSRCQPLLEVEFELAFRGEHTDNDDDGRFAAGLSARSPTLLRYLARDAEAYGDADRLMARGSLSSKVDLSDQTTARDLKESWKDSSVVTSGMEIFTSPQILTSPDTSLSLDRFAGLASIESFEITAVPAGGSMVNKTAKLQITVHDRSRLHEVSAFIRPDAYSRTTVSLSYGWSHPDPIGSNPIADLINQMVVRGEKYNIANSSFSFGSGGGAKITLQLVIKGASELSAVRIADNPKFTTTELELQKLSDAIRTIRERHPSLTKPEFTTKDVRGYQIIDAAANNAELIENYTTEDGRSLHQLIAKLQSSKSAAGDPTAAADLQELLTNLDNFLEQKVRENKDFSVDGKDTRRKALVDHVLGDKYRRLVGERDDGKFSGAPDPYLDETAPYWWTSVNPGIDSEEVKKVKAGTSNKQKRFVSLAKLLLSYVGEPLRAVGQFDEVQFVYYPLNTEAGFASGTSLAAFPVEVDHFRDVLGDHAKRRGNANVTVREFVQILASSVLSDVRSYAFGLREFYLDRPTAKPSEEAAFKKGVLPTAPTDKLIKNNVSNGTFRKPVVEMQVECRGGRPLRHGETPGQKRGLRIVRFHVYDKLASAYEPTLKLLRTQEGLLDVEKGLRDDATRTKLVNLAETIGLDLRGGAFKNQDELKRFISQVTPVLRYGGNHSGIVAATLQTMQNPDLFTVNAQRAMGPRTNADPNGPAIGPLPLRVQPSQLDLTLIGCPLIGLAQQYFIDFDTGTTVDDLYTVTHLSHRIAAGKFESTMKCTPMNAYGSYENIATRVKNLKEALDELLSGGKSKGSAGTAERRTARPPA